MSRAKPERLRRWEMVSWEVVEIPLLEAFEKKVGKHLIQL